jgi:hypothetical protein
VAGFAHKAPPAQKRAGLHIKGPWYSRAMNWDWPWNRVEPTEFVASDSFTPEHLTWTEFTLGVVAILALLILIANLRGRLANQE